MDASLLVVGVMLVKNKIGKLDQPIIYISKLLNKVEENYTTTKQEALIMVFALHKFKHYILRNKFLCSMLITCAFSFFWLVHLLSPLMKK
jgi:hypothetical protein